MEASTGAPILPTTPSIDPLSEQIKQRLLRKGVEPTPKIIHILRKKHHQKSLRKSNRLASQSPIQPLTQSQQETLAHELYHRAVSKEYKEFNKVIDRNNEKKGCNNLVGKPWESLERVNFKELASGCVEKEGNFDGKLKIEHLRELGLVFEERKFEALSTFLDDNDVERDEGMIEGVYRSWSPSRRRVSDVEAIKILVQRLSAREITMKDWKFTRMMKQSKLQFTEDQLLKILGGLGDRVCWRQAMEMVDWVYNRKEHKHYKSRFVYTKLLAVLKKARRPYEALRVFSHMRGDCHIYPDMAAYHTIAVTLGQAGMVRELVSIIETMKKKPSKSIKNLYRKNWDPTLQPDVVVFNSLLNACVPTHHWKGVAWVFQQLRKGGLQPNSATYGLAMEVMLHSSRYDTVYNLFEKMKKNGKSPNALTYKVLVRTFWKEGKVDAAIQIVREMEQNGITGSASVYYELACCLCYHGMWQEAMIEIVKLNKMQRSRPLAVAFTGMILSSLDGGHVNECISIFELMHDYCPPDIGAVNAMLKVYGCNDMFIEAKELFEKVERAMSEDGDCVGDRNTLLVPDLYTYGSMLEVSGHAQQWEYFECVYREMCFSGHQFDQKKYASLLVEASKAGKWHLLEHAFHKTLEDGDIPDPKIFVEMLCQAVIQSDYEKAASIVNTMALAPFQFSKTDWLSLFDKNKDRITSDHRKKLLDTLCNCDMSEEITAIELLKALQCIDEFIPTTSTSDDNLALASSSNNNGHGPHVADLSVGSAKFLGSGALYTINDQRLQNGNIDHHVPADCLSYDSDVEGSSSDLLGFLDNACDDLNQEASDIDASDYDSEVDDYDDLDLPSAEDILRSWKEMRRKDETEPSSLDTNMGTFSFTRAV